MLATCCYPLSLSTHLPAPFSQFPLQSMKAFSQLVSENRRMHTGDSTHKHTVQNKSKQPRPFQLICEIIYFFYNAHPLHAHWYSYFFTPQHTWLFSLSLIMQTWLTHTQTQKYSKHRHIYRETHTHCERASLMDSEDSNFPSATKDRKPSELNYPCLTHTRQDYKHIHMSTHLDTSSVVIVDTHIHISLHSLNHCGMLRITQSKSHTVKLSRALV